MPARTSSRSRLVACAAFVLSGALGLAAPAHAQNFVQLVRDPRLISPAGLGPNYSGLTGGGFGLPSRRPNFGIETGEFVIQPRFLLEGSFTSNFFRVDERTIIRDVEANPSGVFVTHLRPGVGLFNPSPSNVALSLSLDADVMMPVSDREAVQDQSTVGGLASASVAFFPKSALTLVLHEQFQRTLWMRPATEIGNANLNRNELGADLSFHPGGRALDVTAGYRWEIQRFEDIDRLDQDRHRFRLMSSWRFYPLTYAFLEGTYDVTTYVNAPDDTTAGVGNFVAGTPLRAYVGLSGYLTERIAFLGRVGYGNSFLDTSNGQALEDFSSVIGMAQVTFRFPPRTAIHLGAARDFELVPLGGHRRYMRVYGSLEQQIGSVARLGVDIGWDMRDYGAWEPVPVEVADGIVVSTASDRERQENRLRGGVLLDFDISRLFGLTVGYRYDAVLTDYNITVEGLEGTSQSYLGYDEHRVYGSLNLRY